MFLMQKSLEGLVLDQSYSITTQNDNQSVFFLKK